MFVIPLFHKKPFLDETVGGWNRKQCKNMWKEQQRDATSGRLLQHKQSLPQKGQFKITLSTSTTAQIFHYTFLLTIESCQASSILPLLTSVRNTFGHVKKDTDPYIAGNRLCFQASLPILTTAPAQRSQLQGFPCHTHLCWFHSLLP